MGHSISPLTALLGVAGSLSQTEKVASTAFSLMSQKAQEFVINAAMGEYDESGPPTIPNNIKAEIATWAQTEE
jgi:hypothetical protein